MNAVAANLRNMQVHWLIALLAGTVFHEPRPSSLDLDATSGLLLNMLHVRTTVTYNLSPQIESWNGIKIDWDSFFGPFAL